MPSDRTFPAAAPTATAAPTTNLARLAAIALVAVGLSGSLSGCDLFGTRQVAQPPAPPPTHESLLADAFTKPGIVVREQDPFVTVTEVDGTVHIFTMAGHPAHPAVILRKVVGEGDDREYVTSGYGYGSEAAFKPLLEQYRSRDGAVPVAALPAAE